jgi:hypothetical protein
MRNASPLPVRWRVVEPADAPTSCLNCAAALGGPFCAQCGQRAVIRRLTLRDVLHDVTSGLFSLDRALPRTIRDMTVRPGDACRDYVGGHRRRYLPPFQYAMLCFGLLIVVMTLRHARPSEIGVVQARAEAPEAELLASEVGRLMDRHFQGVLLLGVPLFAMAAGWLQRRGGMNAAENLSLYLYVFGHAALLGVPIRLIMGKGTPIANVVYGLASLAFYSWATWRFYRCGAARAVATLLVGYLTFIMVLFVALAVSAAAAFWIAYR